MKKIIWIVITLIFIIWAFVEQTQEFPKVWVQVVGVLLFFYTMMRLSQRINQTEAAKSEIINKTDSSKNSKKVKNDERI